MTSIALSALVLLLLLLPGAIFMKGYYEALTTRQKSRHVAFEQLVTKGLFFAVILHGISLLLLRFKHQQPDLILVYQLISGSPVTAENGMLEEKIFDFFEYFLIQVTIAYLAAKLSRYLVRRFHLDERIASLNNTNYWYQVFSADYLEQTGVAGMQKNADLLCLDILTKDKIIYKGFLLDYHYSPHKDLLESIVLTQAQKKVFSVAGEDGFRNILGDVLVIPNECIVNLNIYYLSLSDIVVENQNAVAEFT